MAKFGFGFCFGAGKRRSSGTPTPSPQAITITDGTFQWGIPASGTTAASNWPNGSYDIGNSITMTVASHVGTFSGTPI